MGTVYCKRCETCDADAETTITYDGFDGCALYDGSIGGEIIADGWLGYLSNRQEIVRLPHPAEELTLNDQGETFDHAAINGRLLRVTNLICHVCGALNTSSALSIGTTGCVPGLVLAVVTFAAGIWVMHWNLFVTFLFSWIAIFVPSVVLWLFLRIRFAGTVKQFRFRCCDNCGSTKVISVGRAPGRKFPCQRCRAKSVTITIAGMS